MVRGRHAFSLIELLIVVAIIAVLVGVAVPFFQDNINEANQTKAREDIEVIRKAIERYEALENVPLSGTSLEPLLGRYLQEIPKDPWGNPYLWDGSCGVLLSYGADALPFGSGGDADISRMKESASGGATILSLPVFLRRAQYQGPWGPPRPPPIKGFLPDFSQFDKGNKLVISFTRPVDEVDPLQLPGALEVYLDGTTTSTERLDSTTWVAGTWMSARHPMFTGTGVDPTHRPELGQLAVRATQDNLNAPGGAKCPIRPEMRLGLFLGSFGAAVQTSWTQNGDPASPIDPSIYGAEAAQYLPVIYPPPPSSGQDGVRIERY